MGRLYFDEDDCDSGSSDGIESSTSGYEEMPPPFATQLPQLPQPPQPPLLFSYC